MVDEVELEVLDEKVLDPLAVAPKVVEELEVYQEGGLQANSFCV